MKRYMTRDEIMEYFDISNGTLAKWQKEGVDGYVLKHIKKGDKVFYFYEDVDRFMLGSDYIAFKK